VDYSLSTTPTQAAKSSPAEGSSIADSGHGGGEDQWTLTGTYVVCLDWGKELSYDWDEMKVISTRGRKWHYLHSLATKEAA